MEGSTTLGAAQVIKTLDLAPHPEGGYYRQTSRHGEGRGFATTIYFLLEKGQVSHWHRIDALEMWVYNAGAPVELSIVEEGKEKEGVQTLIVGPEIDKGQRPQGQVPTHAWQSAVSLGEWSLVTCFVAPGFQFEGFELAPQGWHPCNNENK